ncbi:hypothetical protein JCM10449v2_001998 [Rhodotorula kratochvilovae]
MASLCSPLPRPTKRKATSSKAEPAPKKRSSRTAAASASSDVELDSSPPPAKKASAKGKSKATKAAPKPAKGKSKKQETVLSLSDSDDSDDSDVIIQSPKKKKPTASSSKPAPKAKSKAAAASQIPLEGSTSTPAESMVGAPKKKKLAKELPFEQALPEWFAQFADKADAGKMDGDGIEKLFTDMGLSMDGAYPLILAWKVGAKPGTFGAFYLSDFERAFRKERIDSSEKLKKFLVKQEKTVLKSSSGSKKAAADSDDSAVAPPSSSFRQFYSFLLPFFRAEGAKTLPADAAKAMWGVVLAPKYELGKAFVEFAEEQGDKFKAVSTDLWTQLLDFCESVEPDLTGWSEDDAWPSVIDAFVEWKQAKGASAST